MDRQHYKPTTPVDQEHIAVHNINDPNFDFESEFFRRINKIRSISDLFFCSGNSDFTEITSYGSFGLHYVLEDCAEELRAICCKMLEWNGPAFFISLK